MEPGLSNSSSAETPLTDRYEIEGEIGRGGMATVYRARDLRHGSTVAVKMLRPEIASMVGSDRFTREIRVTARLQHTNILPILDSGESGGVPFYVMPLVEGETLQARLARESQLTVDESVRIARELASALEHAHAQGVIHRDIKPANVLLSHGHAMLADFGIARAIDVSTAERLTESGVALGTAHYMSPEQASSSHLDGRSDLYSLGCVLYEMLVGVPPFTGASVQAVTIRHAVDPVPAIRTVRPSVSAALEAVIMKVLEKVPADRYATASEFRSALELSLTAPLTAVRPVPTRRRLLVASLGAVALAATALVTWQLTKSSSPVVEQNRVLVFPLAGAGEQGETSGEDIATLIGSALDGVGALRWIDAWPLLPARLRQPDSLRLFGDPATRRAIALRARAGFYVSGNIIRRGDSTDVVLELYDVRGDTAFPKETASGLRADIWRLAPRAINKLLPRLIPGARTDVSAWENRPPGAVASFLRAEAAFRRAALTDAMTSYREAVRLDSGFALAAIRGAQAATWSHDPAAAASMVAIARARPLPPRYALFASGYAHYLEGRADAAVAALDSALKLDADMAAAWLQLGEVYMHLLPRVGNTDSLAERAFAQAQRVDSTAANILFHLIEINLRRGDTVGARPLMERFSASASDSVLTQQIEFMADCARRRPHIDWRSAAIARPLALLSAAASLAGGGATSGCAADAFDTMIRDTSTAAASYGYRWAALLGLTGVRLAQGRAVDALATIDSFVTRWNSGTSLFLLGAQVDSLFLARAKTIAGSDEQLFGANYAKASGVTRLWELGLFEARFGRRDVAETVAADLASRAARSALARDSLLAKSLEAHIAVARGDTARAIMLLSSIVPPSSPSEALRWDEATPAALERLTLATLLLARGESERALEIASVIDSSWPIIHTWFLAPSLTIRHRAATRLGARRLEDAFAARLKALRGAGDGSRSSTTH